ncbi:MAG: substrate-binding domain-containing protein, partial [Planctomycetota bacterium]
PGSQDDQYAQRILDKALEDHTLAGVILVGCPRSVQEAVARRGAPAVVFGGVYPNTAQLPSIDIDHTESGRLQARPLLERGHERIGLLMRESWLPGDNLFVDGVNEALALSGMLHGSLTIRSLVWESQAFEDAVRHLLSSDERPTGLICRDRFAAESVARVAAELGLNVPGDLELVYDGTDGTARVDTPPSCVRAEVEMDDQVRQVTEMLKKIMDGEGLDERHVVIPVRIDDQ